MPRLHLSPRTNTLQGMLAVVVSLTAFLLASVVSGIAYYVQMHQSRQESETQIMALIAQSKNTAAAAAFARNPALAAEVVNGLIGHASVQQAEIEGESDLLARAGKERPSRALSPIVIPLHSPFNDQEIYGSLRVYPDRAWITERARDTAMGLALGMAFLILITAAISFLVFRKLLSRPIAEVAGQLQGIAPGTPSRLDVAPHLEGNEVGALIRGFNHLLDEMNAHIEREHTLRKENEAHRQRLAHLIAASPAGIVVIDEHCRRLEANPAFYRLMSVEGGTENVGVDALFDEADRFRTLAGRCLKGEEVAADLSLSGGDRWVHLRMSRTQIDGGSTIDCMLFDVTDRKLAEQAAHHAATHDLLTGALNRMGIDIAIHRALRTNETATHALLMLDLDGFKDVNDTYGHEAGDRLLRSVAQRLTECVRKRLDSVARLGGDEFLVFLNHCGDESQVASIAEKMIEAIRTPIEIPTKPAIQVGVSIGIYRGPLNAHLDDFRQRADLAMYEVKRAGKNGVAFWRP